jgi:hypothetical protein
MADSKHARFDLEQKIHARLVSTLGLDSVFLSSKLTLCTSLCGQYDLAKVTALSACRFSL